MRCRFLLLPLAVLLGTTGVASAAWSPVQVVAVSGPTTAVGDVVTAGWGGVTAVGWGTNHVSSASGTGSVLSVAVHSPGATRVARWSSDMGTGISVAISGRTVFAAFARQAGVTVLRSGDGGGHWVASRLGFPFPPSHISMVRHPKGGVMIVLDTGSGGIRVGRLQATGPITPAAVVLSSGTRPVLAGQYTGSSFVVASGVNSGQRSVSVNGGPFGPQVGVLDGGGWGVAAAIRSGSEPVVAVNSHSLGAPGVFVVRGLHGGGDAPPQRVSSATATIVPVAPKMTLRIADDNVVVAWQQGTGQQLQLMTAVERPGNTGGWYSPVALTPATRPIGNPVLTTGPDGRVWIAYSLLGSIYVRQMSAASGAYRWSPPIKLSGSRKACITPAIGFGPRAKPTVAFACAGHTILSTTQL